MKGAATVIAWTAAILAGAAALVVAAGAKGEAAALRARLDAAEAERGDLAKKVADLRRGADEAAEARKGLREEAAALQSRVEALERRPVPTAGGRPGGSTVEPNPDAPPPPGPGAKSSMKDQLAEFEGLLAKVFEDEATADEEKRFWELARTAGVVDEKLKGLEAAVRDNPADIAAKLDLSRGYIAKLFTVPPGPEMGVWATKAEVQWKDILKLDDRNWDARFGLATSYSRYPEFLNKAPDAIKEFETLRKVQESATPEARHAQTYVQLSLLYRRQGDAAKAKEILEAGAQRFPADEEIRKSLDAASK